MVLVNVPTSSTIAAPFQPGDRVQDRYGWPSESVKVREIQKRLGTIVRVQPGPPNGKGEHGWAFSVRWDGSTVDSHGYTGLTFVRVVDAFTVVIPNMRDASA